jgi:Uma2 family endonuclease
MVEILERPQAPTRRRFDIDAYYRMAAAGVLGDPRRVELIDGEIIDTAAIGSPHAEVTNRLARLFTRALRDDAALVNVQSPLRLDPYNEPEPDLMILRTRTGGYRASHPSAADVLLVVEVSETSLAYDAESSLRSTRSLEFRRSGSSISWTAPSRFIAGLKMAHTYRASG